MSKQMPCSVAKDLIPLLADGLLSPESEALLREHLKGCEACAKIYKEMTDPEPVPASDEVEVDYLKKVRRSRSRLLVGALLAVALVAVGLFAWFRAQAEKPQVSYDEGSQTLVVYAKGDAKDLKLPEEVNEAQTLDAQFDSFRMAVYLPILRTEGESMEEYLPGYLERTNQSLRFLRSYLRENCSDSYPAERADKYVELNIRSRERYSTFEEEDRIILTMDRFYWHREELYVLALLGSQDCQWKHLGYAWYLGTCLNPYSESLAISNMELLAEAPYYEAYRRLGGTSEATPENFRIQYDAISWLCLTKGLSWGTAYESSPLRRTALFKGSSTSDPGNNMSVAMATSFIAYLADEYGFSNVSAFCFGQADFEEAFGTDYQSAYDAWAAHILDAVGEI